jgi:hypothetical protein
VTKVWSPGPPDLGSNKYAQVSRIKKYVEFCVILCANGNALAEFTQKRSDLTQTVRHG